MTWSACISSRAETNCCCTPLYLQLVEVLNEDYAEYISLSGKLGSVDGAILRMRQPLMDIQVGGGGSYGDNEAGIEAVERLANAVLTSKSGWLVQVLSCCLNPASFAAQVPAPALLLLSRAQWHAVMSTPH
jgi:hypothetical protein